jgi:hypothetical protein
MSLLWSLPKIHFLFSINILPRNSTGQAPPGANIYYYPFSDLSVSRKPAPEEVYPAELRGSIVIEL